MTEDKLSQTMTLGYAGMFSIVNLETDRPIGMMADIAMDKVALSSWKELIPNTILNLRLRLPEAINGSVFVVFEAKCLTCTRESGQESYFATLTYLSMTPSNKKRVHDLLVSLGKLEESPGQ